jgi:filamentous hemagglutinin
VLEEIQLANELGIPTNYRVSFFSDLRILAKDQSLPSWIAETFLDNFYYTGETLSEITVYRRFGGGPTQAKLFGGFSSTDAVLSRDQLAILKKWSTMQFEAELAVAKGAKLNVGKIAPQPGLRGGVDQVLLPLDYSEDWVKKIVDLKTSKSYTLEEFRKAFPDQIK